MFSRNRATRFTITVTATITIATNIQISSSNSSSLEKRPFRAPSFPFTCFRLLAVPPSLGAFCLRNIPLRGSVASIQNLFSIVHQELNSILQRLWQKSNFGRLHYSSTTKRKVLRFYHKMGPQDLILLIIPPKYSINSESQCFFWRFSRESFSFENKKLFRVTKMPQWYLLFV